MQAVWFPDLELPAGVHIAQTTRLGGVSPAPWNQLNLGLNSGDELQRVEQNRVRCRELIDANLQIHWLQQVHGDQLVECGLQPPRKPPQADAIFTRHPMQACPVLTADCVPVLLYALDGSRCAAVHAGWRGIEAGIVARVCEQLGPGQDLAAWIGPCIRQAAYEVDDSLIRALDRAAIEGLGESVGMSEKPGHYQLDLARLVVAQLRQSGLQQIVDCGLCTASDPALWYSYRRDGITGRQASLIWLSNAD